MNINPLLIVIWFSFTSSFCVTPLKEDLERKELFFPPKISLVGINLSTEKEFFLDASKSQNGLVIFFISSQCPCSKNHEDSLKNLANEFSPQGFHFIAFTAEKNEQAYKNYFKNKDFSFPVIHDKNFFYANLLGAAKTPHAYLIHPSGKVLFQGGIDDSKQSNKAKKFYLRETLNQYLHTQDKENFSPRRVEVLGCYIQR